MKADVVKFKECLSLLKSVYQYNNNIDIADFVLMTDNMLVCTNDNIRITVPFENDLNFIFAAKEMMLFLSKLKKETLEIKDDGYITCGNIKSKLFFGDYEVLPESNLIKKDDKEISLSNKEMGILEYMVTNPGKIIAAEELLEHVWDREVDMFSDTVKTHIKTLRKKIDPKKKYIKTVRGKGYVYEE